MNKLKLTESQYKRLIESIVNNPQTNDRLDEGLRDVLLGAAMLLGVTMSAQNTSDANNALSDAEIVNNISNAITDTSTRNKLVSAMENIGVDDAESKLLNANQEILKKLDKGEQLGNVSTVKGTKAQIDAKLKSGDYGLVDIEADTSYLTKIDVIKIDLELKFTSDNAFKTGSFELSDEINKELSQLKDSLQQFNPDDIKVTIESSTDTEPIRKFTTNSDSTGNKKLSALRANAISSIIKSFGISDISSNILNDQGPQIYDTNMSDEDRSIARTNTAEYRYITIKLSITNNLEVTDEDKIKEIGYTCKFVQAHDNGGKVLGTKGKTKKIKTSFLTSVGKEVKGAGQICPAFK